MDRSLENIFEKNFENFNVSINFERNFSKNEKKFLEILFFNLELESFYISFDISNLKKVLNFKDNIQVVNFFEKLRIKKVNYTISDKTVILYSGIFPIINSYFLSEDKIAISISQELKLSFEENTFFSYFNFEKYIFMEEASSIALYEYIYSTSPRNFISLSITELKDILKLNDNYTRFFDFEKYILKKIIKDINLFTDIKIEYKKHPSSNTLVNFFFTKNENNIFNSSYGLAKKIIANINSPIHNIKLIMNLIANYIIKKGYEYVYNNAIFADKYRENQNFDTYLKKSLLCDYAEFDRMKKNHLVLFFEKYESYKNSLILHNDLYKYINKILYISPLLEELYSYDTVTSIRNLRDEEKYEYENSDLKLIIKYSENKKSHIQLYFREEVINNL